VSVSVQARTPRSLLGALRRRLRPSALERRVAAFGLARGDVCSSSTSKASRDPIVDRLLDTGAIDRVATTVIELHDRHIPELRADYDRLRERLEREGLSERVLTDWV
jgi:hypothetical protein